MAANNKELATGEQLAQIEELQETNTQLMVNAESTTTEGEQAPLIMALPQLATTCQNSQQRVRCFLG